MPPEISRTGMTGGEAQVLAGALAGLAAEEVGAWVLVVQTPAGDIGVSSSEVYGEAVPVQAELLTLAMLADAARTMALNMADRAAGDDQ